MHRLTGCTLVAICSYLLCNSAHSYIVSRAKNGDFLKWSNPYLRMVGHPSNQSALSHDWIQNVVIKGLRRWEEAGKGALSFDYWQ